MRAVKRITARAWGALKNFGYNSSTTPRSAAGLKFMRPTI